MGGVEAAGKGRGKGRGRAKGKGRGRAKGNEAVAEPEAAEAAAAAVDDEWKATLKITQEARSLREQKGSLRVGISPRPKISGWEVWVKNEEGQKWTKASNAR
eukprot:3197294-Pyramimonas_sp.AAC.1